mgnify:CR=1 FL=1
MIPCNNNIILAKNNTVLEGGKKVKVKNTSTKGIFKPFINIKFNNNKVNDYNYKLTSKLIPINKISIDSDIKLHFCIYRVNTLALKPFLQYLLFKFSQKIGTDKKENKLTNLDNLPYIYEPDSLSNLLIFPTTRYKAGDDINKVITNFITNIIELDDEIESIKPEGFIKYNNEPYIFINIDNYIKTVLFNNREDAKALATYEMKKIDNEFWWATMYDIINTGTILGNTIHRSCSILFLENEYLIRLRDIKGGYLETPHTKFVGNSIEKIIFNSIVGVTKSTPWATHGPFYYFYSFMAAIKRGGWIPPDYTHNKEDWKKIWKNTADSDGKWKRGGIIRCIVFPGKIRVLLNHPNDIKYPMPSIEEDRIKKNEYTDTQIKELKNTLKLRDEEGNWANEYDSVYIGRVHINNKPYKHEPKYVNKKYEQSLPISYHIIDKKSLGEKWDEFANYNIE